MATREEVHRWLRWAKDQGYMFVIIVRDDYDLTDFPVYCEGQGSCHEYMKHYTDKEGFSLKEVYDLSRNIIQQLDKDRAWYPPTKRART